MQVDAIATAVMSALSALFGVGLAWGLMTQKVNNLKEDLVEFKKFTDKENDNFVTHAYFEAVTGPLSQSIKVIEKDIKEILKAVRLLPKE